MNIETQNKVRIYRFDGQYGASYSVGLSKKKQDGSYENGFMPCKFKKDVDLENKTDIYIKSAWLSFNLKDKKTYPFIFINEFEKVEETIDKNHVYLKDVPTDSFEEFGEEIEVDEQELPF